MDFALSEEQRLAVDSIRKFAARELMEPARAYRTKRIPKDVFHELFRKLSQFGILGWCVPEENGGPGLDCLTTVMMLEELFKVFPDLAAASFINATVASMLMRDGTEEQKERYLPGVILGDLIACQALSEPGAGSEPSRAILSARPDRDGYRLNGQKSWISNGGVSDFCVLVARTGEGKRGLTRFLVDRASYQTREIELMGHKGYSSAELFFDNVWIHKSAMLGEIGMALNHSLKDLEVARCFAAALSIGISHAALDASISYAKTREQWGKPIGGHQLIQDHIAKMATELQCARLMLYRAAWSIDQGGRCDTECSMAKYYATEAGVRITSRAIQIHGATGLAVETGIETLFRTARMATIPDGTSEIQKLIIARNILGISAIE